MGGVCNATDAMEQLCREPWQTGELQARSETVARLGLLVHLSLARSALDEVDFKTVAGAPSSPVAPKGMSPGIEENMNGQYEDDESDDADSVQLKGIVEMSSWDGAEGWQVLTVPKD